MQTPTSIQCSDAPCTKLLHFIRMVIVTAKGYRPLHKLYAGSLNAVDVICCKHFHGSHTIDESRVTEQSLTQGWVMSCNLP